MLIISETTAIWLSLLHSLVILCYEFSCISFCLVFQHLLLSIVQTEQTSKLLMFKYRDFIHYFLSMMFKCQPKMFDADCFKVTQGEVNQFTRGNIHKRPLSSLSSLLLSLSLFFRLLGASYLLLRLPYLSVLLQRLLYTDTKDSKLWISYASKHFCWKLQTSWNFNYFVIQSQFLTLFISGFNGLSWSTINVIIFISFDKFYNKLQLLST